MPRLETNNNPRTMDKQYKDKIKWELNMMGGYLNWSYWCLRNIWRAIKCNYGFHNYMNWSAMACANIADANTRNGNKREKRKRI